MEHLYLDCLKKHLWDSQRRFYYQGPVRCSASKVDEAPHGEERLYRGGVCASRGDGRAGTLKEARDDMSKGVVCPAMEDGLWDYKDTCKTGQYIVSLEHGVRAYPVR